jgi:copper(I)-binding protein
MAPSLPIALLCGVCGIATLATPTAAAQGPAALAVTDAYALAVPPGQPNSAVFLTLTNDSTQSRALVAGASPIAEAVELHKHTHEGGVMRMRPVSRIEVPAQSAVQLQPGGLHVMLIGLKGDLAPGDQVDLTLTFDDGTQTRVDALVRKAGSGTSAR